MDNSVNSNYKKDKQRIKKENSYRKIILITIAFLFFTAIAILSMLLENTDNTWTIKNINGNSGDFLSKSNIENIISNNMDKSSVAISDKSFQSFNESSHEHDSDKIPVYIVGEIMTPGIYDINKGTFLYELVKMAGGLTPNAAKDYINMVYKIENYIMIKIPSIKDIKNSNYGGIAEDLILSSTDGFNNNNNSNDGNTSAILVKININTANVTQLDTLPGIGQATAKLIIDYRTKNGKFKVVEDIMKIPGIKESKFSQIKEYITV